VFTAQAIKLSVFPGKGYPGRYGHERKETGELRLKKGVAKSIVKGRAKDFKTSRNGGISQ
jgi:hypothetical protein